MGNLRAASQSKNVCPLYGYCEKELLSSVLVNTQDGVTAVAEQPSFRWFWIWSGAWPAIRQRLRRRQHDTALQVAIHGHGLQHATTIQITLAGETLSSHIVQPPQSVSLSAWPNLEGLSMQAAVAMFLVNKPTKEMMVEVVIPARLMHRAQTQLASSGSLGLQVTLQSDFC